MIKFDNVTSDSLGLRLLSDVEFEQPERDIDEIEIPGRDGTILVSNNRLKSVNQSFSFQLRAKNNRELESQMQLVKNWLDRGGGGFKTFEFEKDPECQYQARVLSATFKRVNTVFMIVDVTFQLQPTKFLKSGLDKIPLSNGGTVVNSGSVRSKPILEIIGTGNITISVNGRNLILQNVTNGIVIDCENQTAVGISDGDSKMNQVFSYPLPTFQNGNNVISWNNSNFKLNTIPRWARIV